MHPALSRIDHRPWPLPPGRWSWRQSWLDLAFAHWPIPAEVVRPLVPRALEVQEFDGTSWIGVVPFRMEGVARRPMPDLPGLSAFPELNLRLYVEYQGTPGVWFLSLDAANRLAVWAARRFFHLPYHQADMSVSVGEASVAYRSVRRGPGAVTFEATYGPVAGPRPARAGSLEHWLTERYCLFAQAPDGRLFQTDVHHGPWPLQPARIDITQNDLLQPYGLTTDGPPPLVHFSQRMDVVVWSPAQVG